MSELKFYELKCRRCGGELQPLNGNMYRCISCGRAFKEQIVEDVADTLRKVLDEQKQEAVANLRRQLWAEMHEQYINSAKIVGLARDIKKYLLEDYFANFCEVANSGNDSQVSAFLNNTSKADMADYADVVLDFMLKSVTAANINAISLFIDRAFKDDTVNYDRYITAYEREAQKVNSGIYELIITRDVFLAYSSADIEKVLELCDYLESNKITCFLALRNLRHGRGAVDNYDQAIKTAIDNCKTVVFVSSKNSRNMSCDAFTKELPYIRQKDINGAPPQFRYVYDKLPQEYMMPRVEYLIDDYYGNAAEGTVKEFFHGLEWCKNKEDVADRIVKYLTGTFEDQNKRYCKNCGAPNKYTAKVCTNCGNREFFAKFEDFLASKIKFCVKCGTQNNIEDKFCAECGSKEFVSTKKEYEEITARRADEERKRKEEEERKAQTAGDFEIKDGVLVGYRGEGGNVVIPDGVTSIGSSAFGFCFSLTNITIPDSVKSIGDSAFYWCQSLTKITIPNGVKSIGSSAFSGCFSLAIVTIPSSVTTIGDSVFFGCSSLKTINCGAASKPDGWNAEWLDDCEAKVVWGYGSTKTQTAARPQSTGAPAQTTVNDFEIKDGVLVKYNGKGGNVTIPAGVTSIGDGAFDFCDSLTYITIPDSVTSIDHWAFHGCISLTSVTIPGSVTSIGENAFFGCSSLISISIPSSVTSIGDYAFWNCYSLKSIIIPNGINCIRKNVFCGCHALTSVTIPSRVTSIGENAFNSCELLSSIAIPSSVTSIGDSAFIGCGALTSITIPSSVTTIGDNVFFGCSSLTTINCGAASKPDGWNAEWLGDCKAKVVWGYGSSKTQAAARPQSTGASAQTNINDFEIKDGVLVKYNGKGGNVTIPAGIKSIGGGAFMLCNLQSIKIPNGVTLIDKYAFYGCGSLKSIIIPDSVTSIGDRSFWSCSSLTSITIPNGINCIGKDTFGHCKSLTSIIIPNSVTSIGENAFNSCELLTSITIPSSVTSIGENAFNSCRSLTSITIPGSVTSIGSRAFGYCSSLKTINCGAASKPDGWNAEWLGDYCKAKVVWGYGSTKTQAAARPQSTRPQSAGAPAQTNISDFEIKDGVLVKYKGVGNDVVIPDGVTSIGDGAFYQCPSLTSITIPDSVNKIGVNAFLNCQSLIAINVSEGNKYYKSIDGNLYSFNRPIIRTRTKDLTFTLLKYANGKTATSFVIPNNVKSIGISAFSGCKLLESITISWRVHYMAKDVFGDCTKLKTIYCQTKKPLFGLPEGWDKNWLGNCKAKVIWNYKG